MKQERQRKLNELKGKLAAREEDLSKLELNVGLNQNTMPSGSLMYV